MADLSFLAAPAVSPAAAEVPLCAWLKVRAYGARRVRVRIAQGEAQWTLDFPASDSPLLLLGFLPDLTATITVQILGHGGVRTWGEPLHFTPVDAPANPLERPPIRLHHATPERMAGRFTFLSIRRSVHGRVGDLSPAQRRFTTSWGLLIAIDHLARIRWMRRMPNRPAGLHRLASGNLFVHDTEFCSREIDLQGETVRAFYAARRPQGAMDGAIPVDVQSLHHQPHQMPNGNFLAVSGHSRLVKDWPASVHEPDTCRADRHVVGDKIVEFTPSGEIVWSWDSFDHLDTQRIGYDALDAYWHVRGFPNHGDWTHCNGVSYDAANDQVIVSLRLQDAVVGVDRASGEIRWILGDHSNWRPDLAAKLLTPVGANFRWPWHGHNPLVTSEGTIVMFDNGIYQARPGQPRLPFEKSFSRGVEYRVDPAAMTVEQVWASALTDADVIERTWAMGDAHRLEASNTALIVHSICMPHGIEGIGMDEDYRSIRFVNELASYARILEYDRDDIHNILFDAEIRDLNELVQWEAFSAVRVSDLYPASAGVVWTEGDALEVDSSEEVTDAHAG